MNQRLTEEIVYHTLANLGVLPASFVKTDMKSIIDKGFLLSEKLVLETENGEISKNIYGCQTLVAGKAELKLLLADCTQEKDLPEYCLLTHLFGTEKPSPMFGAYLVFNRLQKQDVDSEALIAVSADHKNWMPCSTFLQGNFLSAMEQIRDLGFGWKSLSGYDSQYQMLLKLIRFHHNFFAPIGGEDDEE